ncbi:Gfo/Idh/MocA family oxidoreductase [Actinosynnema pretiosum subsp. pretiosum]|uniref:Oxidoreductase domain protein n=2 Tax=Actinosynnema TaxID=40566 RepID=C6WG14_ACTMD|nr:Gfo/Idh/MocA family oxidoreductase [Actinosynnema mirum]ACU37950.1 oxidoreductase domain protein [Actinosynnema mirum DSM 43827]QUF04514.1 Gfo/Idh/MocA family oxidoreductase [Actinosynnema pretiosum subsp. pretiosum]
MDKTELRVGLVGHGFMGVVHSHAWQTVGRAFDLPVRARTAVLCGRDPARTADAAHRLGWDEHVTDWRDLIARDDVDVVDVCTPGDSHAEIVTAALAAGKHVLCEKPLSNTLAEADAMVDAAQEARARGVRSACAYNYRRLPAVGLLRELVRAGRLGEVRHVRASYLQDFFADPDVPLVWRMERHRAGSGALGNLGSHVVDLVQHVTGLRFTGVSALTETFTRRRPLPGGGTGEVTVDDAALLTARLDGGALATCETSWAATGHRNTLRLEVGGTLGAAAFDLDRLNELRFHDDAEPRAERGFRRIMVTEPEHPHVTGWWPPGCAVGFDHPFTHEVRDFLAAIADDRDPTPSFADARQVQEVLDAAARSARSDSAWAKV